MSESARLPAWNAPRERASPARSEYVTPSTLVASAPKAPC